MNRPLMLGHRGLRVAGSPPENTLAAFETALEAGCDGFEFDVRLSSDGIPVICHDPEHCGSTVASCTADRLALPQLHTVLSRYGSRAFLDIELKVAGLEKMTIDAVAEASITYDRLVVSSFLPEVVSELHRLDTNLPTGFIFDEAAALSVWRDLPNHYVLPHHRMVTPRLVEDVHSAGRMLFTWTVNRSEDIRRLAEWKVDGIISDDPQRLVNSLRPDKATR